MLYFLAIVFPPAAVLLCRRPLAALLNSALCLCLWVPGCIDAFGVVKDYRQQQRLEKLARMMRSA